MSDASDAALLDAWRGGDRDAGAELFARHFDAVFRFLRGKADGAVEDLVQETFLTCVRRKDALENGASFRAYLFAVARHALYEHWRTRHRGEGNVDIGELSLATLATSPSGVVARQAEHRLLLRALRAIPLDLQIAVELHYWEGMSGAELALALGIPEGTARSRLRRALEALEEAMAAVADDPVTLESTRGALDKWAESLAKVVHDRDRQVA